MDYRELTALRQHHPAWRLLCSPHAPLIVSFLSRTFVTANLRTLDEASLASRLDDQLFELNQELGDEGYPRPAIEYLNAWADNANGWLRKFYPPGNDEPHFELTPASEKAIEWLGSLGKRQFIGTESRLLSIFALLRQMVEGSESDPQLRLVELEKRRAALDAEIAQVRAGEIALMDETRVKERFLDVASTARSLLADFREVEQNFRDLDRQVRERIATRARSCWKAKSKVTPTPCSTRTLSTRQGCKYRSTRHYATGSASAWANSPRASRCNRAWPNWSPTSNWPARTHAAPSTNPARNW